MHIHRWAEQVTDLIFFKTATGVFVKRSICFQTSYAHNETTFCSICSLVMGIFLPWKPSILMPFKVTSIKEGMVIHSPSSEQPFLFVPAQASRCLFLKWAFEAGLEQQQATGKNIGGTQLSEAWQYQPRWDEWALDSGDKAQKPAVGDKLEKSEEVNLKKSKVLYIQQK